MSLVTIDSNAAEPPYEQVRRQIAEGAASGTLKAGHKLPPVRTLAADLGLAVNTVAKAYRALETDGVIETHGRGGTLIATRKIGDAQADDAAATYALIARRQGLSIDEATRLVEQHWS
ncbi:DNA-binding transcriptional regulator YhcF (GntR family) [Aeromicrobium panaciterrae]|uniref:DNA-binding transcriptional regulator YhcF (GntR family) n=1 Tax=Aeromicrobium panaciterrae TaxID=363861 RepID=A0ABU1URC3_9ACTN|nr:GntR family transcriptional regulator [Aeromicrobium panaciterrae]MDR7087688.1 DNA-binding transcriptional regulator YhcF (GntR family) [Aeromicrobium panaciterrae]